MDRVSKVVRVAGASASPRWSSSATATAWGVGYGKAKEVPAAIAKGVEEAREGFFRVPLMAAPLLTGCG